MESTSSRRVSSARSWYNNELFQCQEPVPAEKPHERCADNCVYKRTNDTNPDQLFCFEEVLLADAANVQCEAISSTELASMTTLLSTISSILSTTTPPPTTTAAPPTSTTAAPGTVQPTTLTSLQATTVPPLQDVSAQAAALEAEQLSHQANLTAIQKAQDEAKNLTSDIDAAMAKINSLVGTRLIKREAITSCADITSFIDKIHEAVKASNYTAASVYAKAISSTSVTCSTEEKQALSNKQAVLSTAKNVTSEKLAVKEAQITELKSKINGVIDQLMVVNQHLEHYGQTTVDHGTHHAEESTTAQPTTTTTTTTSPPPTTSTTTQPTTTTSIGEQKVLCFNFLLIIGCLSFFNHFQSIPSQTKLLK